MIIRSDNQKIRIIIVHPRIGWESWSSAPKNQIKRTIRSRETFAQHDHPLLAMPSWHHYQEKHWQKKFAQCTFWKRGKQFGKVAIFYKPCQSSPLLQKKALRHFYILLLFAKFSYFHICISHLLQTRYPRKRLRGAFASPEICLIKEKEAFLSATLIILNQKQEFRETVKTQ